MGYGFTKGSVSGFGVLFGLPPSLGFLGLSVSSGPSAGVWSCAHELPFRWHSSLVVDDTVQDRFTTADQGEKAHLGVFKSSPSRMSDELTGTCRSQECSWQLGAGYSDIV